MPAAQRLADYDRDNPGKSTRQAAADLGITSGTVTKARKSGASTEAPATVTGRNGKEYPARSDSATEARAQRAEARCAARWREFTAEEERIEITNLRNVFLMNCAASIKAAHYEGQIDGEIRAAARRVADAWKIWRMKWKMPQSHAAAFTE